MAGGFGSTPEIVSATDTPTSPFILAGTPVVIQVKFHSGTVDAGNTGQTHVLRAGLAIAQYISGDNINEWGEYVTGQADGRSTCQGFLLESINMQNSQGTARDTLGLVAIAGQCLIEEDQVYGMDSDAWVDLAYRFLKSTTFENS